MPVLDALGLHPSDLLDLPVLNAVTSRVKTLIPLRSMEILNSLRPDFARFANVCDAIGFTWSVSLRSGRSKRGNLFGPAVPAFVRLFGRRGDRHRCNRAGMERVERGPSCT